MSMNTKTTPKKPLTTAQIERLDRLTSIYYTKPRPTYSIAYHFPIGKIKTDNPIIDDRCIYTFFADVSLHGEPLDLRIVEPSSGANIVICAITDIKRVLAAFGGDEVTDEILEKNLMRTKHLVMRSFYYPHDYKIPTKEVIY